MPRARELCKLCTVTFQTRKYTRRLKSEFIREVNFGKDVKGFKQRKILPWINDCGVRKLHLLWARTKKRAEWRTWTRVLELGLNNKSRDLSSTNEFWQNGGKKLSAAPGASKLHVTYPLAGKGVSIFFACFACWSIWIVIVKSWNCKLKLGFI